MGGVLIGRSGMGPWGLRSSLVASLSEPLSLLDRCFEGSVGYWLYAKSCTNSREAYCGPLSLTTCSGIPYLEKIDFRVLMTL